jgi:hypothetical protein
MPPSPKEAFMRSIRTFSGLLLYRFRCPRAALPLCGQEYFCAGVHSGRASLSPHQNAFDFDLSHSRRRRLDPAGGKVAGSIPPEGGQVARIR